MLSGLGGKMKKGQGFGLVAVIVVLYAMFGGGERAQTSATVQPSATALTAPSTAAGSPPRVIAAPGLPDKAIAEPARVASIEPVLPTPKRPREGERTPKREEEKPPKPWPAPTLATAAIQKVLIAQSIANHSGSCACP